MIQSIDVHIGFAIRARRIALGMSQAELARRIGCPLRQIRKYEYGIDRVGAATLFMLANTLSMPVAEFFDSIRCAGRS
jgi:transcriptional regulator with XRE-family HTH domain